MTALRTARLTGAVAIVLALTFISTGVAAAGGGAGASLSAVREATARYHNINVAKAAGYGEFPDAAGIACIDNPLGGMGIHYVNLDLVLDNPPGSPSTVDPLRPEALVYEPQENGKLKLVALEYIVFQAAWDAKHASRPSLFGHEFAPIAAGNRYGIPAFYELHVWLWKHNPRGMFQDWNPRVSCSRSNEGGGDD
jgi:hypothetical protein